jgi:DNA-binding transcriptional ArsR family regulator
MDRFDCATATRSERAAVAGALASATRLRVLELLRDPQGNFVSQRDGDLSEAGACVSLIARELGVSQPTTSRHLDLLRRAGLIETQRIAQWNFHRRNEQGIERARRLLHDM